MSRVASNLPATRHKNGAAQPAKSITNRSLSNLSSSNINGTDGRGFNIRSGAPAPAQKETVHACPLCNSEYKDPRVLPCTHTYCFNCIRDKLIKNSRITCPKCHYQAHPFEETHLQELPPNLILSQKWRIGARPTPLMPTQKHPIAYHPSNNATAKSQSNLPSAQTSQQQEKRPSVVIESNEHERSTTNGQQSHGVSSIVNTFNRSTGASINGNQIPSRSSSVSNTQPVVSNLIRIYSEARPTKGQQNENNTTANKTDELTKIFKQIVSQNQQRQASSSPLNNRGRANDDEEVYEEITWDNLTNGKTPVAPPFPDQLKLTVDTNNRISDVPERPVSVASLNNHPPVDNLREIFIAINEPSPEKVVSFQPQPTLEIPMSTRLSTPRTNNLDDEINHTSQPLASANSERQHRHMSNSDSVQSVGSDSISRRVIVSPIGNNNPPRFNDTYNTYQQVEERVPQRATSMTSLSRRSLDPFPPPPQNLDTPDTSSNELAKHRSTSAISYRSSIIDTSNEQISTPDSKLLRTERFNPEINISPALQRNNTSRIGSGSPPVTDRLNSLSAERETNYTIRQQEIYISPASSASPLVPNAVISRVDVLLSDQKRLEYEIEEQMRRLKHDYDDVRRQIDRKESSIHHEVKNIATRLDTDITEHYRRKQKIYADLAADANIVGTELQRLKVNSNSNFDNKQQLWANLEQIESNIRNIRHAVEQQKEPPGALQFSEGHRAIAADTIGQITYHSIESQPRYVPSIPPMTATTASHSAEQTVTSLTPYKFIKIDHLSTLEPEAIAISENNKKILLGICNKLFILNEYGDPLKTIQLTPSIRGIAISKRKQTQNIAYISHDEIVSMIDIDSGQTLDCVKETDSSGESGTFLPLGIDTDNINGNVYVCDYRNSCVIKFDDKLEFVTQWRIYNHSDQYDEARPKLISVYGQRLYIIIEHSCKPYYNKGIAYTFSLHICDADSGNIIKIIDAELLSTERLRWPCSVQAINNDKCYILDTMTSGKYFNGQWQKHWSRVLEIGQNNSNIMTELFQLDSEAATMTMTKQTMLIAANGEILFVDLGFLQQQHQQQQKTYEKYYQNLS